jgi:choline dehydrogenase
VGGGVSGCVIAARLSDDPKVTVLLIEAGGKTQSVVGGTDWVGRGVTRFDVPTLAYSSFSYRNEYYFPYDVSVAKGLGGGGVVNGMRWVRALEYDYKRWNVTGWDFKSMLPYYIKSEKNVGPYTQNSPYHGYAGPITVSDASYNSTESTYFVTSAQARGIPYLVDFNGDPTSRIGCGYHQYNIKNGIRDSTAVAYLAPALNRSNLHVIVETQVTKIDFSSNGGIINAVGVQFVQESKTYSVSVIKEVILTAGTTNTPKLLQLSGVGDSSDLQQLNISVVKHLPGVGRNFQDHAMLIVTWDVKQSVETGISSYSTWQRQYDTQKTGVLATIDRAGVFVNSGHQPDIPKNIADIQIQVQDGAKYFISLNHPSSINGTLKLRSTNPLDPVVISNPILKANILPNDVASLVWSLYEVQAILDHPPMRNIVGNRTNPPASLTTIAELTDFVLNAVQSASHMVGTCKISSNKDDKNAVVNEKLQVIGIGGLRIADASVMAFTPNGNLQANVIAIAEKAADLIKA